MVDVSVVVAIYNVEKYLRECLESILKQEANMEVILVNDGATDSSGDICDEYAKNYPNVIKVIKKQNGGLSSARLAGAKHVQGKYVLNVDGDDFLREGMIKTLISNAVREDADVVICAYNNYKNGEITFNEQSIKFEGVFDKDRIRKEIVPNVVPMTDDSLFSPNVWTKLIRTSLYLDNLKYYDDTLNMSEDVAITLPAILKAQKLVAIKEPYYFYRLSDTQMSAKYNPTFFESEKKVENTLRTLAKEEGLDLDEQIKRRYISFAFWQSQLALRAIKDKKQRNIEISKWCDNSFYKDVDKSPLTLKEKIKLFVIKRKIKFLLKIL